MVVHKAPGYGSRSTWLLAYMKVGGEAEKAEYRHTASLLSPFIQFECPGHGLILFTFKGFFTPQLLLSGKAFTDLTKPKVNLVNILGISKSNQVINPN